MTTSRPTILLWTNEADVYRRALTAVGLAERVEVEATRLDAHPDPAVLARCEGLLAWRAAPGLLAEMPRLRWIQALTAAVEDWLPRDDLSPRLTLTCARGAHRVQMRRTSWPRSSL